MMTRAQVDQLLAHADDCISREMQRLNVSGGGRVKVQDDLISVAAQAADDQPTQRSWTLAVWVAVSMLQIYTSDEPGQVSDTFIYPPRFLGYLGKERTQQEAGMIVLPNIVTTGGGADENEYAAGHPLQEEVDANPPLYEASKVTKIASLTFYLRGHFEDRPFSFDTGFSAGRAALDLVYYQHITTEFPVELVLREREITVQASYSGSGTSITPFTTLAGAFGDQTSHLDLLTAKRI